MELISSTITDVDVTASSSINSRIILLNRELYPKSSAFTISFVIFKTLKTLVIGYVSVTVAFETCSNVGLKLSKNQAQSEERLNQTWLSVVTYLTHSL